MGSIFQINESNGNALITGTLNMSSQQINFLADPTSAQDAATKNYVDTIAQGITWKASVQAATTAALPTNTYNNGASGVGATLTAVAPGVLTVDGYAVALNDRLLIKNEVAPANNGIYFVSTLGTISVAYILTRTLDYDTPAEVIAGTATFVEQGTVNSDSGFVQTTTGTITIGTSALSFTQFTGLGEVTAGTGLSKSGNVISLINPVAVNLGGTGVASWTNGQLLIGNTSGNTAALATLSGTTNQITVTNGASSITLSIPSTFIAPGSIAATTTLSGTSETLTATTNQLVLGTTNTTTISSTAPSASRTYTIPDAGSAANMVLDQGNYTIGGTWTFSNNISLASSKAVVFKDNTTNTVTMQATNSTTSWTLKLPPNSGTSTYFLQTDGSGNTTWQPGGSGTINNGTSGQIAVYNGTNTITSGVTASMNSTKLTNLANGTASTDAAAFGQIYYGFQSPIQITSNTAFTTTSNSPQTTNLSTSITPTSSSHRIKVTVFGMLSTSATNTSDALASIFRNTTNLATGSNSCFAFISAGFSGNLQTVFSMSYIDSPATTSATTYAVKIWADVGAATISFGGNSSTQVMILEEIV